MNLKKALQLVVSCTLVVLMAGCSKKDQKVIAIAGSTTMKPVLNLAAEQYEDTKDVKIHIMSNGSINGLHALIDGKCDIADSSTQISNEDMYKANTKGIKIKEFAIALDLIVPIVNHSNPVNNLFQGQLADIYTGLISNWKDAEGKDEKILIADRNLSSGTRSVWDTAIVHSTERTEGIKHFKTNSAVLAYVAEHKSAVGYISKRFINSEVKELSINGIKATVDNGKKGYYPVLRKLYFYVNENSFSDDARSFIVFMLSSEGQKIVGDAGFIPIHSNE